MRIHAHLASIYVFSLIVLCYMPTARPLVVGRPLCSAERRNVECNMRRRYGYSSSRGATTAMMAKPSQPIPRNIKDTVSSLRAAVQEGLKAQQSRMDVELPFASRLGVETSEEDKKKKKTATAEDVERSDRELARLFLEMFDIIGEQVVVAFRTDEDARKANKAWAKGVQYKGRVTSMNPKVQKGPQIKRGSDAVLGFAKQVAAKKAKQAAGGGKGGGGAKTGIARIAPPGTEVLLVVAPTQPELMVVQKLSKELGQGCLIVLLNARLHQAKFFDDEQREYFEEEFNSMYHLRPVGVAGGNEDFLYRAYPKDWTVARKPTIGPPKVLSSQDNRPTQAEIKASIEKADKDSGVFGKLF